MSPATTTDLDPYGGPLNSWIVEPSKPPNRARKSLIIVGAAVVVLGAAVIIGLLIILPQLRGGASSAKEASQQIVTAVSDQDLIKTMKLINPSEREALQRVATAAQQHYQGINVAHNIGDQAASQGTGRTSDLLAGVNLQVTGAQAEVTMLSDNTALLKYQTGEVRLDIDGKETSGPLRNVLTMQSNSASAPGSVHKDALLADLSPQHDGLDLVAVRVNKRWYISPLLSGLQYRQEQLAEDGGADSAALRPSLPAEFPEGDSSSVEAGEHAVTDFANVLRSGDPTRLAPVLTDTEATATYLYPQVIRNLTGVEDGNVHSVAIGSVTFVPGQQKDGRQTIAVDRISGKIDGDMITVTGKCVKVDNGDESVCLNHSGYWYDGGAHPDLAELAGQDGKFGLVTVKEHRGWKVSLLDSAADGVIGWLDSISKDQLLAMLDRTWSDDSTVTAQSDQTVPVKINDAGYGVVKVTVPKDGYFSVKQVYKSLMHTDVYRETADSQSIDNRSIEAIDQPDGRLLYRLHPGTYKVVVWSYPNRNNDHSNDTGVRGGATNFTLERVTASPYVIVDALGLTGEQTVDSGDPASFQAFVPSGNKLHLNLTVASSEIYDDTATLTADVDGKTYTLDTGEGHSNVIKLPAGRPVWVQINLGGYYGWADYQLSFG